jgi:hypothetical protein
MQKHKVRNFKIIKQYHEIQQLLAGIILRETSSFIEKNDDNVVIHWETGFV